MQFSVSSLRRPTSPVAIVSLFFLLLSLGGWGQELERARASEFPLAVTVPPGWESMTPSPDQRGEVLFLQSKEGPERGFISYSLFPINGSLEDLVKRQTYHVVVNLGVPMSVNEDFKLRGARGHKWVYQAPSEEGGTRQFYRLYMIIPGSLTGKRLLVVHGDAPAEQAEDALALFSSVAQSTAWGLAAEP